MMNLQNGSTKINQFLQAHLKLWENRILPHLPEQLGELAEKTGALKRKKGPFCSGSTKSAVFICLSNFSFRILAVAACALGISNVSDTAWRKRFSKAAPFLYEVLH